MRNRRESGDKRRDKKRKESKGIKMIKIHFIKHKYVHIYALIHKQMLAFCIPILPKIKW